MWGRLQTSPGLREVIASYLRFDKIAENFKEKTSWEPGSRKYGRLDRVIIILNQVTQYTRYLATTNVLII